MTYVCTTSTVVHNKYACAVNALYVYAETYSFSVVYVFFSHLCV